MTELYLPMFLIFAVALLAAGEKSYGFGYDIESVARIWRGGCIIRSAFLGKIKEAFDVNPNLSNLMLDSYFKPESRTRRPRGGA